MILVILVTLVDVILLMNYRRYCTDLGKLGASPMRHEAWTTVIPTRNRATCTFIGENASERMVLREQKVGASVTGMLCGVATRHLSIGRRLSSPMAAYTSVRCFEIVVIVTQAGDIVARMVASAVAVR